MLFAVWSRSCLSASLTQVVGCAQVSLADVNERLVDGQKNLFYLCTPTKALATASPYFEAFDAAGVEVRSRSLSLGRCLLLSVSD